MLNLTRIKFWEHCFCSLHLLPPPPFPSSLTIPTQVLQQSKGHERAQTLLQKARQFKEKKEAAVKATNEARLEDAERIYTEAIAIDPRNKVGTEGLLSVGHLNRFPFSHLNMAVWIKTQLFLDL